MTVVADVNWADLNHAYGSAEQTPIALHAWLRGDDRAWGDIEDDDEVAPVIADYESPTVAEAALKWIYVSVFHQGSLYPASAPTCRLMVAVLNLSPVASVQAESLNVLDYALSMPDDRRDWAASGFNRLAFRDLATYDEVVQGYSHYLSAIGIDQPNDARRAGARMLAWMPDRAASAEEIIEVLTEEPDEYLSGPEAAFDDETTAMLLRTLGLVARGTAFQDQAEAGIRSFLEDPGGIGLAACLALVRLRRVDRSDADVVARLRSELDSQGGHSDMTTTLLDALVTVALHCALPGTPEQDRAAAARRVCDDYLASIGGDTGDWKQRVRIADASSKISILAQHHRFDDD